MAETAVSSSARSRGKRKGPRAKHQPQRTCIACRDKTAKRALIRLVRTPEGQVVVDPSGRLDGRGAYLCEDPNCWQRAFKTNAIGHALRIELDDDAVARLREFASQLSAVDQSEGA